MKYKCKKSYSKKPRPQALSTLVSGFGQNYVYHQNNRFPFLFFTVRFENKFFTIYKFNTEYQQPNKQRKQRAFSCTFQSLSNNLITINVFYLFEFKMLTHPTYYDLHKQACFFP